MLPSYNDMINIDRYCLYTVAINKVSELTAELTVRDNWFEPIANWRLWGGPCAVSLVLVALAQYNFLAFHTLAELFAIVISYVMFALSWSTRDFSKNNFLLFLACGYFWIGSLDLIHTFVYKGMNVIVEGNGNLSVQFWIATRYSEALLLLAAPFAATKQQSGYLLMTVFGVIALVLTASIFSENFPIGFVEGQGLTDFKIYSEYLIVLILLLALIALFRHGGDISVDEKALILISIVFTMVAELAFTFYVSVYGLSNLVGHIFKFFSFWFIFQAIVLSNLKRPYAALLQAHDELEHRVQEGTEVYRKSEANLAEAQRIAGLGSWKTNLRTGETIWSDQRYRIFGYQPGEIEPSHENFRKSLHPEDRDRVISELREAYETGRPLDTECRILWPNGNIRTIHIVGESVTEAGHIGGFMSGTVLDITERKQSEELLRKLSRAVEQSPSAVFITDVDGTIEYVNPKFTEITGYSSKDALGQNPRILGSGETSKAQYSELWNTILDGKEWRGELKDRHKDGHVFWAYATIAPVKDERGKITHYIATHEDITHRKEAELSVRDALARADIANRSKSELLANMSHELRTPLNAIIGFSSAIKAETFGPIGHQKYSEYIDDIADSGQHLLELINDILDVSAIEAGKLELHESMLDMPSLVEASVRLVKHRANEGNVRLLVNIDKNIPPFYADERRIKQIILNLLTNAIKFTPATGRVSLSILLDGDGGFVITVADTGIGMNEIELAKALTQFGQVDRGDIAKHEGTGLGLPLTKSLIELHGGAFTIASTKGEGTTVTAHFPPERTITTP